MLLSDTVQGEEMLALNDWRVWEGCDGFGA